MIGSSSSKNDALHIFWMMLLAFIVGVVGGFGAILFRGMIAFVHNIAFNGTFSLHYNANVHAAPSVWGAAIILVPVAGAVIVTWLTENFAKEVRGSGVPEVMNAIYYKDGKIRPSITVIKAMASSLTIGTGGSAGREGPIIQIGSAFASFVGQLVNMTSRQRNVLIAAGAAAGISATFDAPLGGLAFAMELMLINVSAVNVALVSIATVTATVISRLFLGTVPAFDIHSVIQGTQPGFDPVTVALFVPFGLAMGGAAALFIHAIYWTEDRFTQIFGNAYLRHMSGMLLLGLMMYAFMYFSGHYYVTGVGYSTILDVLRGLLSNPWFLLLLFAGRIVATSLTLGSGASGGVFSPSLFCGATLGAAFALFAHLIFPDHNFHKAH